MAEVPRPFMPVPTLLDVEGRQVICSVTGRMCPARCPGRRSNQELLATTPQTGALLGTIKLAPPEMAAKILYDRAAQMMNNAFSAGLKPGDICANLAADN